MYESKFRLNVFCIIVLLLVGTKIGDSNERFVPFTKKKMTYFKEFMTKTK